MKITVVAPAYYPDLAAVNYLADSAGIVGIPVHWYGLRQSYEGWWRVQVTDLIPVLQSLQTSHVLYTDARDAFFCKGLRTIEARYRSLGSPSLLISVEGDGVNAGGWMGEREAAIEALEKIKSMGAENPQTRWRQALAAGWVNAEVDEGSRIFRVVNGDFDPKQGWPCILHFAGGYCDPHTGKRYVMEPIWQQFLRATL